MSFPWRRYLCQTQPMIQPRVGLGPAARQGHGRVKDALMVNWNPLGRWLWIQTCDMYSIYKCIFWIPGSEFYSILTYIMYYGSELFVFKLGLIKQKGCFGSISECFGSLFLETFWDETHGMGMIQNFYIQKFEGLGCIIYNYTHIYIHCKWIPGSSIWPMSAWDAAAQKKSRDGHSTSFQFQGKFSRDIAEKTSTILPKTSWPWAAARNFVTAYGAHAAFA